MADMIVVGVIGLLGTVLGFSLNEIATRRREARTEKRQKRSVRTMLSLEIQENLALLRDFAAGLHGAWTDVADFRTVAARDFIAQPLPSWSHKMWESQMPLFVMALSEEEIGEVHVHHRRLDSITAVQATLTRLAAEQDEDWRSAQTGGGGVPLQVVGSVRAEFDSMAPELWTKCAKTIHEVLGRGNPLRADAGDDQASDQG